MVWHWSMQICTGRKMSGICIAALNDLTVFGAEGKTGV